MTTIKAGGSLVLTLASVLLLSGLWCIYLSPVSTAREQTKQFIQDSVTLNENWDIVTYTVTVEDTDRLTITLHRTTFAGPYLNSSSIPPTNIGDGVGIAFLLPQVSLHLYDPFDHIIWSEQGTHIHSTIQLAAGKYKLSIYNGNDFKVECFITLKVMGDVKYQPLQPVGSLLILVSLPTFGLGIWNLFEDRSKGDKSMSKIISRFREWFRGYDDAPLWLCFCRFIFAVSSLACILSFFGPAILVGDLIGFFAYQEYIQTDISFFYIYIVVVLVTFTLAVISGIPAILYEKKKMEKEINE